MGNKLTIPRTPEEITSDWLTDALTGNGILSTGRVVSVTATTLGEGVGFIGQVVRLVPVYDGPADGAPMSIVAKIPTTDPGGRQIAALYGMYERELQFYRQFSDRVTFRVPQCYYGDGDEASSDYILLLEDLAPTGVMGDQLAGCDLEQATVAVRALAQHHATWWEHEILHAPWLGVGLDLVQASMTQMYEPSWPRFLEYFGERFSDDVKDVIPQLGARILELIKELEGGPFTIAHGDYRADNLFFGRAGSAYDVAVIDWQSPNKGWATYDLSYFICGSFDTDLRHKHEKTLCDTYYAGLIAGGVTAYSREQFEADYGRSLLVYLALFVVTGATVDTANERGLALFNAMFDRLNGSIADANALQYLA